MEYLLREADLQTGYEVWTVTPQLEVYRRNDQQPWVATINRSGLIKRRKFYSKKNGRVVKGSSTGEAAAFSFIEASPWAVSYRPQGDLLKFGSDADHFWALPDAAVHCADGRIVWIEGKYLAYVDRAKWERFDCINRILAPLGMTHSVLDQGWCLSPPVAHNLQVLRRSEDLLPDSEGRHRLLELLADEPVRFADAAQLLSGQGDPDYNQLFASMARRELQFEIHVPTTPKTWVTKVFRPDWAVNPYCASSSMKAVS